MNEQVQVPNVGDVIYSSWGYEQTNVDFYEVVRASKASVWLVAMNEKVVSRESDMSEFVEPADARYENGSFMVRWNPKGYAKIGSYEFAVRYDGKPKFQSHWY